MFEFFLEAKMYLILLIFHISVTGTEQKLETSGNNDTSTLTSNGVKTNYFRQQFCLYAYMCPNPKAYHQNCVLSWDLCCPDLETVTFIPPGKYVNNDLPRKRIINKCYSYYVDRQDGTSLICTLESNCMPNTCMLKRDSLQENGYTVGLGWRLDNDEYHFEGRAVLVARYFLITSAHNMNRGNPDIVRFYEPAHKCQYYEQKINVNDVYIHPEYKPFLAYNDIAIIKLAEQADKRFILYCIWVNDNNLVPHSLARYEYSYKKYDISRPLWFGYFFVSSPLVKLEFDVKIFHELNNTDYNNKFTGDPRLPNGIIHSQLCAADPEGNIATQGDSSGPLFMERTLIIKPKSKIPQNIRFVMGITVEVGEVPLDGVYTRVSSYLEWIDSIVLAPSPAKIEWREDELKINSPCFYRFTGQFGTCVNINNCTSVISRIQKISPQYCLFEENQPIVCCPNDEKISTKVVERNISNRKIINMCYNYYFNASYAPYGEFDENCIFQKYPNVANFIRCSWDQAGIRSKQVSINEHMYMASLGWRKDNTSYEFRCGAFLVARNFVLTAAHCMTGENPDIVRLGDKMFKDYFSQDINIAQITIHSEYLPQLTYNDIAIIKLAEEAKKQFILACLWEDDADLVPNLEAIGFGATKHNGPTSDELYLVSLQLMNDTVCNRQFSGDYRLPNGFISSHLCAGDPEQMQDTCKGDSGGPLFSKIKLIFAPECKKNIDEIAHVVGIISFGPDCAQSLAGGYTRISSYLQWIDDIIFGK